MTAAPRLAEATRWCGCRSCSSYDLLDRLSCRTRWPDGAVTKYGQSPTNAGDAYIQRVESLLTELSHLSSGRRVTRTATVQNGRRPTRRVTLGRAAGSPTGPSCGTRVRRRRTCARKASLTWMVIVPVVGSTSIPFTRTGKLLRIEGRAEMEREPPFEQPRIAVQRGDDDAPRLGFLST